MSAMGRKRSFSVEVNFEQTLLRPERVIIDKHEAAVRQPYLLRSPGTRNCHSVEGSIRSGQTDYATGFVTVEGHKSVAVVRSRFEAVASNLEPVEIGFTYSSESARFGDERLEQRLSYPIPIVILVFIAPRHSNFVQHWHQSATRVCEVQD